jgi:hypothetical protein
MTLLVLEAGEPAIRNRVSHRAMPGPPAVGRGILAPRHAESFGPVECGAAWPPVRDASA